MANNVTLNRAGVLATATDPEGSLAIRSVHADYDSNSVSVVLADDSTKDYSASDITVDQNTGRLTFSSDDTEYRIRELREDDGEWISTYKVALPIFAIESLITNGAPMNPTESETLAAYSLDDSAYVLGVLYSDDMGRWMRVDGDWVLLSRTDNTYNDMIVTPIAPDKAADFLDLYDNNYVSVQDLDQYEVDENTPEEDATLEEVAPENEE